MSKQGKKIFVLICLLFFCLLFPKSAFAWDWLIKGLFNAILAAVFSLPTLVSGLFLAISGWLLSWVTSPAFIAVKFTDNPFVTPAWGLVRDFANMGIVLALVAIGLGTALGIAEYQAKKTLPWLLAVALGINFTPVICGIFIDISNIIMNFFLEGVTFGDAINKCLSATRLLWSGITTTDPLAKLGLGIGMIAFNIMAGIVFLGIAIIFTVRYVALWTLVILSPLAFLCYVLPATRSVWKMWWGQFINWCFIGAIAAFWVYLGEQMLMVGETLISAPPPSEEFKGLSFLAAYIVPIIFLWQGLIAAPVLGGLASEKFIELAKGTAGAAVGAGVLVTRKGARLAGEKTAEKFKEWREKAGKKAKEIEETRPTRARALRGIARTAGMAERLTRRGIAPLVERPPKEIEEEIKKLEGLAEAERWDEIAAQYTPWASAEKKIAIATILARRKGMAGLKKLGDKKMKEATILAKRLSPKHRKEIVGSAPELTNIDEIAGAMVDITDPKDRAEINEIATELAISEAEAIKRLAHRRVVAALSRKKIADLSSEVFDDEKFRRDFVLTKDIRFFADVAEYHGQEPLNKLWATARNLGPERIGVKNMRLLYQSLTSPLREYFPALEGAETRGRVRTLGEISRRFATSPTLRTYDSDLRRLNELREEIRRSREAGVPAAEIAPYEEDYNELLAGIRRKRRLFTEEEARAWREIEGLRRG